MKYLIAAFAFFPLQTLAAEGLPLADGYYVSEGLACGEATDADVALVHPKGVNVPEALCEFEKITEQSEHVYGFAATCAHPEQRLDYLNEGTVELFSDASFEFYDGQIRGRFSYCEPDRLPPNLR